MGRQLQVWCLSGITRSALQEMAYVVFAETLWLLATGAPGTLTVKLVGVTAEEAARALASARSVTARKSLALTTPSSIHSRTSATTMNARLVMANAAFVV
jgi:hypothetical protein